MPDARPQVLVVEDSADLRELMIYSLEKDGFAVASAPDGVIALDRLAAMTDAPPDVVVLDLMLPIINGLQVLADIRDHPRLARVPVLVTTGTMASERELRVAGATAVLRKPFDGPQLTAATRSIIASTRFAASKAT